MSNKELQVNTSIQATEVRLIHEDGRNEVMSLALALDVANSAGLDLIQMNEDETPVCKVIDYAQYQYTIKQAEKLQKKKQRASQITTKEIQLNVGIQDHDLQIKQRQVQKFLEKGDQVRISLRLTGRSRANQNMQQLARDKVDIFIQGIGAFTVVSPLAYLGDTISVVLKSKAR